MDIKQITLNGVTYDLKDQAARTALAACVNAGNYNSTDKLLEFKNGNTLLFSIDAAAFIKDGMVDSVIVEDGNLVITFNTESGKEPISIPISDIFDASNYYTKEQTDTKLSNKEDRSNKVTSIDDNSTDTQYPSAKAVNTALTYKADKADVLALSGSVSELANEIEGTPQATIDPGYIVNGRRFYYCTNDSYKHTKIAVTPGQVIDFKAGRYLTDYIVLKSYPESFSSIQANFVAATGYSDRVRVAAGETTQFTIPADGHWLCTSWLFNNIDYSPAYVKSNGVDLITGKASLDQRVSALEEISNVPHSFLKYIKSAPSSGVSVGAHPKFEFYQYNGSDKYFELDIELCKHTDDTDYQYLWRITSGMCYSIDDLATPIGRIMDSGENEWACKMKDFEAIGGFVGGLHGGERIDLDTNCFVKFFADGKLLDITSDTNDFTMDCDKFEYIQKSALYIVKDSSTSEVVAGHPKYGYHTKITKFEDGGYNVENRIEIDSEATIPYSGIYALEYFSGLSCVGKAAATSALLPTSILVPQLSGSGSSVRADNTQDNKIVYWNDTNNIVVEVVSGLLQGLDDSVITNFDIYDRVADSKYYRYALYNSATAVELTQASPIRSYTNVKFK